jgi:diphthine-ammonia ligase
MMPLDGIPFFCSWSGGKDSCLALYHAIRQGGRAHRLLTMMTENDQRSRSHGLSAEIVRAQAQALNLPVTLRPTGWNDYESNFAAALAIFRQEGIQAGVFGDIDLQEHLDWVQRVCAAAGLAAHEPLWQRPRRELLDEFIALGFKARIVAVREDLLDRDFLGRTLTHDLIAQLESTGVDASGERGEYHTVVEDGPLFSAPVPLKTGAVVTESGYLFIDMTLAD